MCAAASPGQVRSQCDVLSHDSEQDGPVQVTWQVALSPHETDPDFPTVTVQVECSQSMLPLAPVVRLQVLPALHAELHEPVHTPVQLLPLTQASEQLLPVASQPVPCQSQVAPD